MKRINLLAKRVILSFIITLQVLFYPSAAFAQVQENAPATDDTNTTAAVEAAPEATTSSGTTPTAPSSTPTPSNSTQIQGTTESTQSAANTPAPSTTSAEQTQTSASNTNASTDAEVDNAIDSEAQSGDATVTGTNRGGNATSGDAFVMASLINMLQSQSNVLGNGSLTTFEANIEGDVYGDLLIDPGELSTVQNTMLNASNVQVNTDAAINNDVKLSATSGNATVEDNRRAGDATSGDAHAVANIMNLINSSLTANNSFFGVINIHGNLNGDIMLPPGVIDTLLASNSIPTATITADFDSEITNNTGINNNVTTAAESGDALVSGNRRAGDATSGKASTSITVLNLTGQQIVGANTLLVFVNVQGKWVGMLVNAPTDATAAALGGGITDNTQSVSTDIDSVSNAEINNDVSISAQSGDASVLNNRRAGNATTGNASASANIANVANSQFALSNWFGVLFINVFGSWLGSFGIDTAYGNKPSVNTGNSNPSAPQVFQFVPTEDSNTSSDTNYRIKSVNVNGFFPTAPTPDTSQQPAEAFSPSAVLASATNAGISSGSNNNSEKADESTSPWTLPIAALLISGSLLGIDRLMALRERRFMTRG